MADQTFTVGIEIEGAEALDDLRGKLQEISTPQLRLEVLKWLSPSGGNINPQAAVVILQAAKVVSDFVIDGVVPSKPN